MLRLWQSGWMRVAMILSVLSLYAAHDNVDDNHGITEGSLIFRRPSGVPVTEWPHGPSGQLVCAQNGAHSSFSQVAGPQGPSAVLQSQRSSAPTLRVAVERAGSVSAKPSRMQVTSGSPRKPFVPIDLTSQTARRLVLQWTAPPDMALGVSSTNRVWCKSAPSMIEPVTHIRRTGSMCSRGRRVHRSSSTTCRTSVGRQTGRPSRRSSKLTRPVRGPITSGYGMRRHPLTGVYKLHDGIDIGSPCRTPVRAAASGRVVRAAYHRAWGYRVVLRHRYRPGAHLTTSYNHLRRFIVHRGQDVVARQTIGHVGSTGYSTGCHLHFSVYNFGSPRDPRHWLRH
jgi:hypothetical protein